MGNLPKTKTSKQKELENGRSTREELEKLETRKGELLQLIEQINEGIRNERDALAQCIFDAEAKVKRMQEITIAGTPQVDIYNTKSILETGVQEDVESLKKNIDSFYKAYVLNPYGDNKKTAVIIPLLDELEKVCEKLDNYYNLKVAQAIVEVEKAREVQKEALKKRKQYRIEMLGLQKNLNKTASHSVIGENELLRHNVNSIKLMHLFSMAHTGMDGAKIVEMARCAITSEVEMAKKQHDELRNDRTPKFADSPTWWKIKYY